MLDPFALFLRLFLKLKILVNGEFGRNRKEKIWNLITDFIFLRQYLGNEVIGQIKDIFMPFRLSCSYSSAA
jgi:hypothetical protein